MYPISTMLPNYKQIEKQEQAERTRGHADSVRNRYIGGHMSCAPCRLRAGL
jgi:hypothetical protein